MFSKVFWILKNDSGFWGRACRKIVHLMLEGSPHFITFILYEYDKNQHVPPGI